MKVGIIEINVFNNCPYVVKYLDILKEQNIEYDLIGWDRDGNTPVFSENNILFRCPSNEKRSIIKKLPDFIKYARFLNKILKEKKYDKIILLNTLTAFLVINHLKRYKNKFILDIRDLSYEYFSPFKKILGKIIDKSFFTCISSKGFEKELPKGKDYVMAHNFQYGAIEKKDDYTFTKREETPINILHIGIGRGDKYNKLLSDIFGGDKRFSLVFAGVFNDTPFFIEYAKKYDNIKVYGSYKQEEKIKFIKEADMLFYNYMSSYNCDCALANKYYDGLIFKKPLIGNLATYSGKLVSEKSVGISLDFDDKSYADKVYNYYMNLEEENYLSNVKEEISRVLSDDRIYLNKIREFLES